MAHCSASPSRLVLLLVLLVPAVLSQAIQAGDDPTASPAPPAGNSMTIRFVNDLHYRLYPVDDKSAPCSSADADTDKCVGGVRCLLKQRIGVRGEVWLSTGVALGYGGADDSEDPYRLLKAGPATEALKQIKFDALSVDADLFRYGVDAAARDVAAVGAGSFVCANCRADSGLGKVAQYKIVATTTGCSLAVIGVINKTKADSKYFPGRVLDELESISQAVASAFQENPKVVPVVIGEVSAELAQAILKNVSNVNIVLYSGSGVKEFTKSQEGNKVAATLPSAALGSKYMQAGRLALTVDSNCSPTITELTAGPTYDNKQTECGANDDVKKIVTTMLTTMEATTKAVGTVKSLVTLNSDNCGVISCTLGQLTADGLRAALLDQDATVDWADASRAVILTADEFKKGVELKAGAAIGKIEAVSVMTSDPALCWAKLSGTKLWNLTDYTLRSSATFPQLSGLRLDVAWDGSSPRLHALWIQDASGSMVPVGADEDTTFRISTPCSLLDRYPQIGIDKDHRGQETETLTLSDGLLWHTKKATNNLVPPQVESRVRMYVGMPSQAEICEDWVGMTVAYTLLVLGATVMVAYQGYQFWRFRTTLSYVR